jgi:hypothetical protein
VAQVRLHRKREIFLDGQMLEYGGYLKGPGQTHQRTLVHGKTRDVQPVENDTARVRFDFAGELIDSGGFSRTVGTDERVNLTGDNAE